MLDPFEADEHAPLQDVLAKASEALQYWLETENLDLCMGRYNVRLSEPEGRLSEPDGRLSEPDGT